MDLNRNKEQWIKLISNKKEMFQYLLIFRNGQQWFKARYENETYRITSLLSIDKIV